ncbi:MAG: phosphate/phosphite/phosphonate ABC transporter substrate-binding protein [Gammaproteobacteria bacterium]|nr:phosphate/phosphite/phosphonate ABC transporter substrate-binding protein [Gammaproteobacteria bacterium]MBU1645204.1 phosphate/phosphite/phosphonate ABC transporter substrate-binding protein [Gammaproteobacteria bacterium]MBU1973441.1 phosphate/phosphite/phosphonate ABC transporter substrate-binding protein [Gammaproteobacteria bacterium]
MLFNRRRMLLATSVALLLPLARGSLAAAGGGGRVIEIGLMPYMPTARLFAVHESLRRYIEATFKRPAVLSTAPDFHTFQRRVLEGELDLALTGPNIGWQAHLDGPMTPVAVSRKLVVIQIMVARDGPIRSLADLRGKAVATIDAITTTSQTTVVMLREAGLEAGRDVQLRHEKTPFNSAQNVVLGETAAAGFPNVSLRTLPPEMQAKLRIIAESDPLPGVMFISRRAPGIPSPEQFQAALLGFADTPEGKIYIRDLDHAGLQKPDFKQLKILDRLIPEVRRAMAKS